MQLSCLVLLLVLHCASCQNLNFQVDWRPAGVVVEPSIRADSTLVVNERQLILYGGRNQTEPPQFRSSAGNIHSDLISADSQRLVAGHDLMQFNLVSKAWRVPNINFLRGSPGPRYGHVARALPGLDAMVLHGGFASDSVKGDLWVYDVTNSAWHKPTISGDAPAARGYHTLTWEPAKETKPNEGAFLMHGGLGTAGYQSNHSVLGDVWALQINCTMTKVNQTNLLECAAVWTELHNVAGSDSVNIQRYGHATTCYFWNNKGHVLSFMGIDSNNGITGNVLGFLTDLAGKTYTLQTDVLGQSYSNPRQFHTVVTDQPSGGTLLYLYGGYTTKAGATTAAGAASGAVVIYEQHSDGIRLHTLQPTLNSTIPAAHHSTVMVDTRYFKPTKNASCTSEECCEAYTPDIVGNLESGEQFVMMTYGGQDNKTTFYNDMWGWKKGTGSDESTFVWFKFSAARASAEMFQSDVSEIVSVVGGVSNLLGSVPDQHLVAARQNIDVQFTSTQSTITAIRGNTKSTCEQVASLHDFTMVEWTDKKTGAQKIIVHGGRIATNNIGIQNAGQLSNVTYILTKGQDTWSVLKPAAGSPTLLKRYGHCAAIYDKFMVVFGGVPDSTLKMKVLPTLLWLLDLETGLWNVTNSTVPLTTGVFGHSCSVIDDKLIVIGGVQTGDDNQPTKDMSLWQFVQSVYMFNLHRLRWNTLQNSVGVSLNKGVAFHKVLNGPNQTLIVIGGITNSDSSYGTDPPPGILGWTVSTSTPLLAADFTNSIQDSQNPFTGWFPILKANISEDPTNITFPGLAQFAMSAQHQGTSKLTAKFYGGFLPNGEVSKDLWEASFDFKTPSPIPPPFGPTLAPTGIPTENPDDENENGSSLTTILLIVGGIAVVGVIVGVGFVIGIYYRRNARRIKEFQDSLAKVQGDEAYAEEDGNNDFGRRHPEDYRTVPQQFGEALVNKPSWVIDFSELRIIKQIGHGSTCVVHVGWWGNNPVAVKRFFLHAKQKADDFYRETLVHRQLKHRNVLELLAITINPPCSVTPLMRYGSLFHIIQSEQKLHYSHILQIAMDTVDGMRYLHSQNVIHRDLKTLNLLVDDSWCVKVCDFGIARFQLSAMTAAVGSIQYMAPEVFMQNHCTIKSDVYSFAMVLWEMITREVPYSENPSPFAVCCNVREGKRLPIPESCQPEYRSLIEKSWNQDANERPDFEELFVELQSVLEHAEQESLLETPKGGSLRDSMKNLVLGCSAASEVDDQFALMPANTSESPSEGLNETCLRTLP